TARTGEEYSVLVNECGAGVILLDPLGVILRISRDAEQMLGAPGQDHLGKTILEATLSSELSNKVRMAAQDGEVRRGEVPLPGPAPRSMHVSITPIRGVHGEVNRLLLIMQDVSELRRLEMVRRDFVANVSHELRTPLASIRAMAETLQE